MINYIDLLLLRNAEKLEFMALVRKVLTDEGAANLNIVAQYTAFVARLAELEAIYLPDRGSAYTAELTAFDERRDNAQVGLNTLFESYSHHFEEDKKAAAILLMNSMKKFGSGLSRQNYMEQTANTRELINDWESELALAGALELLGATEWKDELKAANQAFELKYDQRNTETAIANPDTVKQKRIEVKLAYEEMVKFLEANAVLNSSVPVFQRTINRINGYVDSFNATLNNRASGNGEEGNTEEGEVNEGGEGEITPQPLP